MSCVADHCPFRAALQEMGALLCGDYEMGQAFLIEQHKHFTRSAIKQDLRKDYGEIMRAIGVFNLSVDNGDIPGPKVTLTEMDE